MVTTKNNCSLCDRNDVLFLYDFVSTQIQNAFFTVNRNLFHKEFVDKIQLCVICSHKVELSSGIVREYEEMCNRNNILSVKKCFFCEDKAAQLVDFHDNPIEVHDKIRVFLSSVNVKHNYRDLKSCIRCLYNLDVWNDMRRKLYLKMDISDASPVDNNDKTRTNRTSIRTNDCQSPVDTTPAKASRGRLRKVTQNSSPVLPEKSAVSTPNKNNISTKGISPSNNLTPNKTKEKSYKSVNNNTQKEKLHWCKYLTKKLKSFQTVEQMIQNGPLELNISNIEDNDKLFNTLPFVEILVSSQINKDNIPEQKEIDPIIISDTEDVQISNRRGRRHIQKPMPKQRRSKRRPKTRLKFKMPIKSKLSLIKPPPSFEETHSKSSSSESHDSVQEILSDSELEHGLMCEVCDKTFTVKCEFLVHKLKHEKMEDAVVNVFRHSLPTKLNVSELSPKKTVVSPEKINKLLTKWIGEHAALAYADADNNVNKVTADINEENVENMENEEESEKSKEVETTEELPEKDKDENIGENHDTDKNEENAKEDENVIEETVKEAEENVMETEDKDTETNDDNTPSADNDEVERVNNDDEVINELEKEVISDDKDKSSDGEKLQENDGEKTIEIDENESDEDVSPESPKSDEKCSNSEENDSNSKVADNLENGNDKEEICEEVAANECVEEVTTKEKESKSDFDEFSNSDFVSPPVMTCEDLISILETNIEDEDSINEARGTDKRKRESDSEEVTPKRKRVRFADEKEVFTPNQDDGVLLEKIDESDHGADQADETEDKDTETISD